MSIDTVRASVSGPGGINSELDAGTKKILDGQAGKAKIMSDFSEAMAEFAESVFGNQQAHGIAKSLLQNAKQISQGYLSIA